MPKYYLADRLRSNVASELRLAEWNHVVLVVIFVVAAAAVVAAVVVVVVTATAAAARRTAATASLAASDGSAARDGDLDRLMLMRLVFNTTKSVLGLNGLLVDRDLVLAVLLIDSLTVGAVCDDAQKRTVVTLFVRIYEAIRWPESKVATELFLGDLLLKSREIASAQNVSVAFRWRARLFHQLSDHLPTNRNLV